jgi:serine protease DegS
VEYTDPLGNGPNLNPLMNIYQIVSFAVKSAVAGLAIAFIAVWLNPEWAPDWGAPATRSGDLGLAAIPAAVDVSAPAVVNIYSKRVVMTEVGRMRQRLGLGEGLASRQLVTSLGSGVIIDPAGYVVTNHHVIEMSKDIKIQLADGRISEPEIIGVDVDTDLALLKIDLRDLPVMTMGRSDRLRVGEVVLAIGNPYGLSETVTQGIVSATGRTELGLTIFENFIQTDAAINTGNSGGALVNLRGELIGINTAVLSGNLNPDGIGFAIPVNMVRGVSEQLREHGRVRRGWLGVTPRNMTNTRTTSLGIPVEGGVEIDDIYPDSPAVTAGLQTGDIITHMNGQPIQASRQALNIVATLMPGDTLEIKGMRAGQQFSVVATLSERPTS